MLRGLSNMSFSLVPKLVMEMWIGTKILLMKMIAMNLMKTTIGEIVCFPLICSGSQIMAATIFYLQSHSMRGIMKIGKHAQCVAYEKDGDSYG